MPTSPAAWPLSTVFTWLDIRACQDSNGDGIGDIPGLISRLDHFRDIGIGAFLFPGMQPTDFAYGGTMITAERDVDPRLGTIADAERLFEEAHRRDIRIILGWMPFSTHPDHAAFAASRDQESPNHERFSDYYLWTNDINTRQPRRWGHWEWDGTRKAYYHTVWLTTDGRWCPEVNLMNPVAREEHEKTARFWLDRGVDGFWVDCGVWGGFMNEADHVAFSRGLTDLVHSYGAKWIISEGSKSIQDTIVRDAYDSFFADQARAVPVYKTAFRKPGQGTLVEFFEGMESHGIHEALMSFYDELQGHQVMHPLAVPKTVDPEDEETLSRTKLAFLMHATLPLIPILRFPQHLGVARKKSMEFVDTRPAIPMWEPPAQLANGGFTTGTPFLPMEKDERPPGTSVAEQLANPDSLLRFVRQLYEVRKNNPALWAAPIGTSYAKVVSTHETDCFAYLRKESAGGQVVLVAVNLSGEPLSVELQVGRSESTVRMLDHSDGSQVVISGGKHDVDGRADSAISFDTTGLPSRVDLTGYGYVIAQIAAPSR